MALKDISSNIMAKDRLSIKQRSWDINTTAALEPFPWGPGD